jgi:hypothetical protein
MSYFVEVPPAVRDYLLDPDRFPPAVGQAVLDGAIAELADNADYFLRKRPVAHESYIFGYDYAVLDETTGVLYQLDFKCDGAAMPQGVVRIVYVDLDTAAGGSA